MEAEKSSLLDRLSETEGDLDEVKRQLRASIEREQVSCLKCAHRVPGLYVG